MRRRHYYTMATLFWRITWPKLRRIVQRVTLQIGAARLSVHNACPTFVPATMLPECFKEAVGIEPARMFLAECAQLVHPLGRHGCIFRPCGFGTEDHVRVPCGPFSFGQVENVAIKF